MTDHEKILNLIENVDINDTAALDEIDRLTWFFFGGKERNVIPPHWDRQWQPYYTRSRDALKAARPDGRFGFAVPCEGNRESNKSVTGFAGVCFSEDKDSHFDTTLDYDPLPTEELAELHAIIQAEVWERENND